MDKKLDKTYFSLVELMVVVAIIAILASFLVPSLAKSRKKARQVTCVSNMHQLGIAEMQYALNNDNTHLLKRVTGNPYGQHDGWKFLLAPYVGVDDISDHDFAGQGVFKCPSSILKYANERYNGSLGFNGLMGDYNSNRDEYTRVKIAQVAVPSETVLIADAYGENDGRAWIDNQLFHSSKSPQWIGRRHNNGINVQWVDGHTSWKSSAALNAGKNGLPDYYYLPMKK